MQDLILIPVSKHEFKEMIRNCIAEAFNEQKQTVTGTITDKPMSVKEASEFLNLANQTIYGLTSKNLIPHFKRGKKLYFNKTELISWLNEGKQKSIFELDQEAEFYQAKKHFSPNK